MRIKTTALIPIIYIVFIVFLLVHLRRPLHPSPPLTCPTSLPTLLNLPAFLPYKTPPTLNLSCLKHSSLSLLTCYASLPKLPPAHPPHPPHLHTSLSTPPTHLLPLLSELSNPSTLTLQYSFTHPDDTSYTSLLLSHLPDISPSTIHILLNPENSTAANSLIAALNTSLTPAPTVHLHLTPDHDLLYLLHKAPLVFLHRGPIAALAALAVSQTLYYHPTYLEPYILQNKYKWLLPVSSKPIPPLQLTKEREYLNYMGPVLPTACLFEPFGKGDGEKIMCVNAQSFSRRDCWVMSIGCAGRWSFEQDIVARTKCNVHTFDCTGDWTVPKELKGRVTLHKLCLGAKDDLEKGFGSWGTLVGKGGNGRMPSVVKMDIEGYEFPVMKAMVESGKDSSLPEQIAMEVHGQTLFEVGEPFRWDESRNDWRNNGEDIARFFGMLGTKGYRLVHRNDNPFCGHCSEVTLVREAGIPRLT
eukprot:GFKZ01015242.1.p1 GENE.GFKZ01015242.1~~GFKZ01015242.1.p1  ORF type:complete len:471 (-),score=62.41 GFKZ01015242.1:328-1740(-)